MTKKKSTILETWPALEEDLRNFLSDTDAWIITELKAAYGAKDWDKILKVIDIMEMVHNMSHGH
jgi:hypothetical protein